MQRRRAPAASRASRPSTPCELLAPKSVDPADLPGEAAETDKAHSARHRNAEAAKACARCYFINNSAKLAR